MSPDCVDEDEEGEGVLVGKPRPIASTHNNIYWGCLRDMLSCFINLLQTSCQKINPNHNINYTSVYKSTSEYEHRVRMPRVLMEWRTWSLRSRLIWYLVYNDRKSISNRRKVWLFFLSWCDIKGIFNLYNLKKTYFLKITLKPMGMAWFLQILSNSKLDFLSLIFRCRKLLNFALKMPLHIYLTAHIL